jgi:iron complex transport system substrate-binding protein
MRRRRPADQCWRRVSFLVALLIALIAIGAPVGVGAADKRVVTDSAGRRVEIPARVDRVFAAGGPASVLVYALAPEKLVGWNRPPSPEERAFLPDRAATLPALGRLTGRGNTANVEVVLAARPDVIVDYGTINPTYASLADQVQQQTGVPYLLYDGSLSAVRAVTGALGEVLDARGPARDFARYADRTLGEVDRRVARVPADKRPRVYYARGPKGLETAAPGSINVESLDRMGARNVAGEAAGHARLGSVSVEQVLAGNPDVIVTVDPGFAASIKSDKLWKDIKAVRERRVYLAPLLPFPWVDSPPSVNRLIGLWWLGRALYPAEFPEDIRSEARTFYSLAYHRMPDDRQLDALLGAPGRSGP